MRKLVGCVALAIGLVALGIGLARANQTVLGKTFVLKDPKPGLDPTKRVITVLGKELASDDVVLGNPILNGAAITIIANGGTPGQQSFFAPPGAAAPGGPGWKALGNPPIGYSYKDALGVQGPIKVALIKKTPSGTFLLKAVILGKLGLGPQPHISVLPPNPGTEGGMLFFVSGGDGYCVGFGGVAGGLVTNSVDKVFKVTGPTVETCTVSQMTTTTGVGITTTTSTLPPTFAADVQPIFTNRCATSGCHSGPSAQQGLNLNAGSAYASLDPGVAHSTEVGCTPRLRVDPGSPLTSYVIQKLANVPGICGGSMPFAQPPLITLAPAEYSTIFAWVSAGAPNN